MSSESSQFDTSSPQTIANDAFDSGAFDNIDMPGFESAPAAESEQPADEPAIGEAQTAADATAEAQSETSEPAKQPVATTKPLTFRSGDQEVALDETAVIPWKVDGQVQSVTVKDLLTNYAGKVAWDKRLNEAAAQRKAVAAERSKFDEERNSHKALVDSFVQQAKGGRPEQAIEALLKMTGLNIDPREFNKNLREHTLAHAQRLAQMTEQERAAYEMNEERERFRAEQESWKQQRESEQANAALKTRLVKAIEDAGVDAERFAETSKWLAERWKAQGMDANQLTPEHVTSHIRESAAYELARDAIAAIEPNSVVDGIVTDDSKWDKLARLAKANPDISRDEFIELYREVQQAKSGKAVAQKIAKAPVATVASAKAKAKPPHAKRSDDFSSITADDLRF